MQIMGWYKSLSLTIWLEYQREMPTGNIFTLYFVVGVILFFFFGLQMIDDILERKDLLIPLVTSITLV